MKNLCVLIALVGIVNAIPSETDGLLTSALKMIKECGDNSMFLCMKVSLLKKKVVESVMIMIFEFYEQK